MIVTINTDDIDSLEILWIYEQTGQCYVVLEYVNDLNPDNTPSNFVPLAISQSYSAMKTNLGLTFGEVAHAVYTNILINPLRVRRLRDNGSDRTITFDGRGTVNSTTSLGTLKSIVTGATPIPITIDVDPTLAANSDTRVPSQRAIKQYVDTLGGSYEVASNKATTMTGNETSNVKYLSAKAVYDWAIGTFTALTASSFGTFVAGLTGKTTPVDADVLPISDSAASDVAKKVTLTNFKAYLKTYFDTVYTTTSAVATQITTALSGYLTSASAAATYLTIATASATYQAILTAANFGSFIVGLTSKTTPVDADEIVITDSAASGNAKRVSFTNLKAFYKTYFDTIYTTTAAVATQITTALSGYLTSATAASTYQVILTAANFGTFLTGLTAKTTPIDADQIAIVDSADSNNAKKVTFTNLKVFLKTYFDTLYTAAGTAITSLTGDVTTSGTGAATATIANNAVTDAKFRQSAGLSVVGRSTNSTGNVADITGSGAFKGLRVNSAGTGLEFAGGFTPISFYIAQGVSTGSTTNYFLFNGSVSGVASASKSARQIGFPAGTWKNMYIRTSATQPASGSLVFALHINNTTSSISITIAAGSAAGTFSDTTNTATTSAGDLVVWEMVNNASAASTSITGGNIGFVAA